MANFSFLHEKDSGWLKKPCAGIAMIALCGTVAGYSSFRPVGEHRVFEPQNIELSDNDYAMASWNMYGKATSKRKAIKRLIARHSLDVIGLQEVYGSDIRSMRRSFKGWTIIDSPADSTRHRSRGGYHNLLMVKGRVDDVKSTTISQVSHFEQRSLVLAEFPAVTGVTPYNIVVGTTHVGRGKVSNKEQFPKVVDFIHDSTADDASVLMCGDFNRGVNTTKRYFGEKWSITHTANTTPSGHKVDFCLSQNKGDVTITSAVVDKSEETDHYPVIVHFAPTAVDLVGGIVDYFDVVKVGLTGLAREVERNINMHPGRIDNNTTR